MNQPSETLPDPKAIALISNITQLMDEVEQMLRGSNNQQEEVKLETNLPVDGDTQTQAATFLSEAGRKIVAGARRADEVICAYPYRSLAIALGAGALLGMVLAGRRNSAPA
jgi:ElaB/YqjD/DUF883 family membrane-anchored ribosome-binding protein